MSKSKLALIAVLVGMSIASPAFAQDHTGSPLPHYFNASGALVWGSWSPPQAPAEVHQRVARSARQLYMTSPRRSGRVSRGSRSKYSGTHWRWQPRLGQMDR